MKGARARRQVRRRQPGSLENLPGDHDLIVLNFARAYSTPTAALTSPSAATGSCAPQFPTESSIDEPSAVQLQADGKILIGTVVRGEPLSCNPSYFVSRPAILRSTADGTPDGTYGDDGFGTVAPSYLSGGLAYAVDWLGRAVIGGHTYLTFASAPTIATRWSRASSRTVRSTASSRQTNPATTATSTTPTAATTAARCASAGAAPAPPPQPVRRSPPEHPVTMPTSAPRTTSATAPGGCTAVTPTPRLRVVATQSGLAMRQRMSREGKIAWKWNDESHHLRLPRSRKRRRRLHPLRLRRRRRTDPGPRSHRAPSAATIAAGRPTSTRKSTASKTRASQTTRASSSFAVRRRTFQLKGRGRGRFRTLPCLVDPVTVQLIKHESLSDACFESVYAGDISPNRPSKASRASTSSKGRLNPPLGSYVSAVPASSISRSFVHHTIATASISTSIVGTASADTTRYVLAGHSPSLNHLRRAAATAGTVRGVGHEDRDLYDVVQCAAAALRRRPGDS